jgi:hypothetical protein
MQHDSIFGFMDAVAFPDPKAPGDPAVGHSEGAPFFNVTSHLPDGSEVTWELSLIDRGDDGQTREQRICAYPCTVQNGRVSANVPARYARRLEQGTARIRLLAGGAATPGQALAAH